MRRTCLMCLLFVGMLGMIPGVGFAQSSVTVINQGISGNNTQDLLSRAEQDVLSGQPDVVIVMVGTNDMVNSKKLLPLAQYEKNLTQLVAKLKTANTQVVLMSLLPVDEDYLYTRHPRDAYDEKPSVRIASANRIVGQVARKQPVHFLDMHRLFTANGEVKRSADSFIRNEANSGKTDGVHPTANGYRFMAEQVFNYLTENKLLTKQTQKISCFGDSITFGLYMTGEGTATGDTYPAFLSQLVQSAVAK